MNSSSPLTFLLPTVVAIVSWFVGSWLSVRRDRANKRREMRVQYLIEAYRRLEAAGHRPLVPPYSTDMESAIADIQLFGSPTQVTAARKFAFEMAEQGQASLDDLLADLRSDLRKELHWRTRRGGLRICESCRTKEKKEKMIRVALPESEPKKSLLSSLCSFRELAGFRYTATLRGRGPMSKGAKRIIAVRRNGSALPGRNRALLERIQRRREQIRQRIGMLSDSSELIREERERRF